MGNAFRFWRGFMACCVNDDPIPDKLFIVPGLSGPDGKLVSMDGLHVDFMVQMVYKSRLIQIEFTSNLSGQKRQVFQCLYVSNLPNTARVEDIQDAFKQSSRNIVYIVKDYVHFYEGQVTIRVNDVIYDLGEYLLLREFSRFQTLSRPTSPRYNTPIVPENFPIRIDLTKTKKEEMKIEPVIDINTVHPTDRITFISRGSINNSSKENLADIAKMNNSEIQSPRNDHVERSIDKLEIIEGAF